MKSRFRCDPWFHLLLSASGRAFSWAILVDIHIQNSDVFHNFFIKATFEDIINKGKLLIDL